MLYNCKKSFTFMVIFSFMFTSFISKASTSADSSTKTHEVVNDKQLDQVDQNKTINPISLEEESPITPIDEIIDASKKQLDQVKIALTTVSGILNESTTTSVPNKKEALSHIKALLRLISTLQKEQFAQVDLETAYSLLRFTKALCDHLSTTFHNNFAHIETVDINSLIKKTIVVEDVDPQQVVNQLCDNEYCIVRLTKQADSFGLRWYNKLYRTIDDYIISPANKYSVPSRTLTLGASAFFCTYAWWRLGNESFREKFPITCIKDLFGDRVPHYPATEEEYKQFGLIGKLDYGIGEMQNHWSPLGNYTGLFLASALAAEWKYKKLDLWKKISEWTNRLRGGSYLREAQKAAERTEKVRFNDVFGQEEIIRYFKRIVAYLENPEPFDHLGLTPPKGILCIGDTRTGKTYTVTALFTEISDMLKRNGDNARYKFITLPASRINYYGIKACLEDIKRNAPCIVFIDEIDLLDLQRTGKNETLSEFLTCMSGTVNAKNSKKQVIIIAATNRPENLDVALRQPGRFGKELRFEYPNYTDRVKYITHKLEKLSLDLSQFNIEKLAHETQHKSYEALKMLIDNALLKARIRGEFLTQDHIDEILEEDIYHIIPNNTKEIPDHEKEILSAHMAAQALALTLLDSHTKLSKVTIKQVMTDIKEEVMGMHLWGDKDKKEQTRFEYGKIFTYHAKDSINMNSKEEKLKLCQFHLAGFIGEELLLGSCGYSCHAEDDKSNALKLAQSIVLEGLEMKSLPKHLQAKKHEEALAILDECKKSIKETLTNRKDILAQLAQQLREKETVSGQEVNAMIISI